MAKAVGLQAWPAYGWLTAALVVVSGSSVSTLYAQEVIFGKSIFLVYSQ
jgi:hypothetical protein